MLQRYQRHIVHYREVPGLSLVARRLDPRWTDEFLQDPWDPRPAMEETMPLMERRPRAMREIVRVLARRLREQRSRLSGG